MGRTVAVYYSSSVESGNTARLLAAFMRGIERGGDSTEEFGVKNLDISPCTGELHCWFKAPGRCYIQDGMQKLYPALKGADTLVLGTPVYIPLPGEMQNLLNRLCPLLEPKLETRDGRTRARMRPDVSISRIALVASSGWWELGNFDTIVRIVRELAEDASVTFSGALLRPHASAAFGASEHTRTILEAADRAGFELASTGAMSPEALAAAAQPVVDQEPYRLQFNAMVRGASQASH